MEMIAELYRTIAREVYGTSVFEIKGMKVDLMAPWQTYDFCALVHDAYGLDPRTASLDEVRSVLTNKRIDHDTATLNLERGVDLLWKQIRKTLSSPGFLVKVPVYLETLAKRSEEDPRVVERFQVILAGSEMGKGFSELNDPVDQAGRFTHQQELRDAGDDEAQMNDAEYVEALEYGMPPTFGFGVSERLFSTLEGVSIREAQIFPLLRPR
jgi:lysyl-tRNA synthetase class 2